MNMLSKIGWNQDFQSLYINTQTDALPARVLTEYYNEYKVMTEDGVKSALLTGELIHTKDYPAVGDWVTVSLLDSDRVCIEQILPRKSKFSRLCKGKRTQEQIVATNIDTVFILNALNQDFNLRRLERYLTLALSSGAQPVIILNKADLCEDVNAKIEAVKSVVTTLPVHVISCYTYQGLQTLEPYLVKGHTLALLGSSGVGKSTLLNCLSSNQLQLSQGIRKGDDKGYHTTTTRELFILPSGALMIDTPGMRELQLWDALPGFEELFKDILELETHCKFGDCKHKHEPQCAINLALQEGHLDSKRLRSFFKLQKEVTLFDIRHTLKAKYLHQEAHKARKKRDQKIKRRQRNRLRKESNMMKRLKSS